jgi:hypothetical protein
LESAALQQLVQQSVRLASLLPQAMRARQYLELQWLEHKAPAESLSAQVRSVVVLDRNKRAALAHCQTVRAQRQAAL